jgi:rSAM/selenodomain-associated transferase 1
MRDHTPSSAIPILVFAKAPVPGEAKTRLIPRLGAAGAARLHATLIDRTVETAVAAGVGPVELCCAPDATHPFFRRCAERHGVSLAVQGEGDLGARMLRAFDRVVSATGPAILVGTDCPVLTSEHLHEAARCLSVGHDAVLAPAEDGGYVLIGLARVSQRVFGGIAWGGSGVMRETRLRLTELGWRWRELAELWDVDRPEDITRLVEHTDHGARYVAAAMNAGD